jgi:transposase
MIDYQQFCQLQDLHHHHGLSAAQIADTMALDPRTVAYWLRQKCFRPRQTGPRPSKLDPFKPQIQQMLEKYPYSAAQVLQRLREQGFEAGYSIVKEYIRKVRPKRQPAFLKLAFAPGECAQVDWGSCGSVSVGQTTRRLSFFVMVMCYSRMMYVEFTVSQTMEPFLACHQQALEFFGAAPPTIMVDNLKSAVLKRALGQTPVFHPKYAAFAEHYGFAIVPCNVGQAHEKGRVENGVGYVKKNFLAGLDVVDFSMLNPAARPWLDTVANVRHHGETRKAPIEMWNREKPHLGALPLEPFDIATVSQGRASSQFRITLDTNRYSVPAHLAGQPLTLKLYPDRLCLYYNHQLVARHSRS